MRVGIALGSNLGDRADLLRAGRGFLLTLHDEAAPPLVSGLYETAPVGCPPGSLPFLNAVVEIGTSYPPRALLNRLADFEQSLGRPARRPKNSPRPLDLDILYADDLQVSSDSLTLPHPRIAERRFVLRPLADIRATLILPGDALTIAQHLAELPGDEDVMLLAKEW